MEQAMSDLESLILYLILACLIIALMFFVVKLKESLNFLFEAIHTLRKNQATLLELINSLEKEIEHDKKTNENKP